jgi:DNA-binding Xre family transcriptional regulator
MRDFHSIIKVLKVYLHKNSNKKILDKDVAIALEISQANFATIKRRNSIPYVNLLEFCKKEKLCSSELFFDA